MILGKLLVTYTNGDLEELMQTFDECFDDLPGVRDYPADLAQAEGICHFWAMTHGYTIDSIEEGCSWLVVETLDTEDGRISRDVECGAPVHITKHPGHGDGWACSFGHSHEPLSLQWEPYGSGWQEEIRQKLADGYDLTREEAWHFKG